MIVLDTTALSLLFVPNATSNTKEGKPIKHAKERMEFLVERLSQEDGQIIIPTPCLAEICVKLDPLRIDELLKRLKSSPWFRVESFDAAAAVELGLRTAKAIAEGDKREGLQADHTKVKFDRQIVAIAMVNGAEQIISDDGDIVAICQRWKMPVSSVGDLPLPPFLIPPPLLANLEEASDTELTPAPTEHQESDGGDLTDQARAKTVGQAESRRAGAEPTEERADDKPTQSGTK